MEGDSNYSDEGKSSFQWEIIIAILMSSLLNSYAQENWGEIPVLTKWTYMLEQASLWV